jgi:formiminotetrahydrofolate cyclodeaminase
VLTQLSVADFVDRLAAAAPTPGGGSAAALSGSFAAALVQMVCDLTIGKEGYQQHEPLLRPMRAQAESLRRELLALADKDSAAYDRVIAALRLPKASEAEKAARKAALGRANLEATEVPLATAEGCARVLGLAADLLPRGNRNARSDVGTAAALAAAGLRGALMNVRINLGGLSDAERASGIRGRAEAIEKEARLREEEIASELEPRA